MNHFSCICRLVTDPEIRCTDGKTIATFRIAIQRKYKNENGEKDTDFFNCVSFGRLADTIEKLLLQKGTKLYLAGEIRNNHYTDKNGTKHYSDEFMVYEMEFVESKAAREAAASETATESKGSASDFVPVPDDVEEEWLPFNS